MRTSSTGSVRNRTSSNRLSISFEKSDLNAASYEGFNAEDLFTALPARYREAGRPLFVYLTSDLPEHQDDSTALQQDVFLSEKISIGMKMFSPIRVDGLRVDSNHPYARVLGGAELPRLVVVGSDGRKIASLEGRASESRVFALLKKASDRTFKSSIDSFVNGYQDFLDMMDKVDVRKEEMAKERAESAKSTPALEKKWAKEDDEVAKLEQNAMEFETKLLELRRKGEKGAVAKGGS